MNKLLHIFLCVLCVFALDLAAQIPSPTPGYSESADPKSVVTRPNERPRTLDEIKALAKANRTKDDLNFFWDKFKDESVITTKYENIVGSWEGAAAIIGSSGPYSSGTPRILIVGLEWRFAGQTLTETPDRFALVFDGMSPSWQFRKTGDTLYILFDGDRRMQLEAAAADSDVKSYKRVDEKIAYVITREQIATLAAARKVEVRIGDAPPREIKPKVLKRWRSLLDVTQLEAEK